MSKYLFLRMIILASFSIGIVVAIAATLSYITRTISDVLNDKPEEIVGKDVSQASSERSFAGTLKSDVSY